MTKISKTVALLTLFVLSWQQSLYADERTDIMQETTKSETIIRDLGGSDLFPMLTGPFVVLGQQYDDCDITSIDAQNLHKFILEYYLGTAPIVPVNKVFFDEPVTVVDSFFIGRAYCSGVRSEKHRLWMANAPIMINIFGEGIGPTLYFSIYRNTMSSSSPDYDPDFREWSPLYQYAGYYPFLFPIIAPPDENNPGNPEDPENPENPGDTLSIETSNILNRFVSVSPNPAYDLVNVVSSIELKKIEAFDVKGKLVFCSQASGHNSCLDISGWSNGYYILHITTEMGTATKKILVK